MDSNLNSLAGGCEMPGHPGDITEREAEVGILPSHGITIHALHFADRINNSYRHLTGRPRSYADNTTAYDSDSVR